MVIINSRYYHHYSSGAASTPSSQLGVIIGVSIGVALVIIVVIFALVRRHRAQKKVIADAEAASASNPYAADLSSLSGNNPGGYYNPYAGGDPYTGAATAGAGGAARERPSTERLMSEVGKPGHEEEAFAAPLPPPSYGGGRTSEVGNVHRPSLSSASEATHIGDVQSAAIKMSKPE